MTAHLLATRDALAAVIFEALDVSGEHPAVPIAMEERIADALLASGVIRDADTLADDEALVDRVAQQALSWIPDPSAGVQSVLRALAAALAEGPA